MPQPQKKVSAATLKRRAQQAQSPLRESIQCMNLQYSNTTDARGKSPTPVKKEYKSIFGSTRNPNFFTPEDGTEDIEIYEGKRPQTTMAEES